MAYKLHDIFGRTISPEIQDHGLEAGQAPSPVGNRLSQETGIPLVATNGVAYLRRDDARAHENPSCCIQTGIHERPARITGTHPTSTSNRATR